MNRRLLLCAPLAAALSLAVAFGCNPPAPVPSGPLVPPHTYTFHLVGPEEDLPWNKTIYVSLRRGEDWSAPEGVVLMPDRDGAPIQGRPGDSWLVLTDKLPTPAMQRTLWMTEARGTYGDAWDIDIPLAPRATVVVEGDLESNDDALTFADTQTGARLVARRDERAGLKWGIWMAGNDEWSGGTDPAPPAPWAWRETRPGKWVVGARLGDRQWLVRKVELVGGQILPLDLSAQPAGGATVTCEDPAAEILIGGELPLPAVRVQEIQFRARWTNVPPGKHTMRYPSGAEVPFECADGGEVTLPKKP